MLAIERDLSFLPIGNPSPRLLTRAQIETYNRDGYITPLDLFSPAEADANRAYFDGLMAKTGERGAYGINCYQARCRGIWDLCNEPRILDLVEDLVGPNIICWASHFLCKLGHDERAVPWHQDASYWQLSPARTVTVWLAIDDADEENSAMQFIAGTHRLGHLEWRSSSRPVALHQEIIGAEGLGEPVSNNLRAGQISLHADMLAHGSRPNASSRRRCGLTIRYCAPEVKIVDPVWERGVEAIICRGMDPTGIWKHHPRPLDDNIDLDHGPRNIGGN